MVSPPSQRGNDHIEESNSTASLFLGGVRRIWMSGPKPVPVMSGPRESRPTMRPVANPSTSDQPAHAPGPTLMSPVTPGANLPPASLNPSGGSSSVNLHNKDDAPTTAFPSPVPSAVSHPSPVTTCSPTNDMTSTAETVRPQPPHPRAPRPEARDTRAPVEVSTGQEANQVSVASPLPARASPVSRQVSSRHGTSPLPVQSPRPVPTAQTVSSSNALANPTASSQSTRLGQTPSHLGQLTPSPSVEETRTAPPRAVRPNETPLHSNQPTSNSGAQENHAVSSRAGRVDQTPIHSNQPTSISGAQVTHTASQPVRPDDTRSSIASRGSNVASPQSLRLETNGIQAQGFPHKPSDQTWKIWNRKLDMLDRMAASSSSLIFEPRVQLLRDACGYQDTFYLLLHQVYCGLYIDPIIPDDLAPLRSDACFEGLKQLRYLLEDNVQLPRNAILNFSHFPGALKELSSESWFSAKIQEVTRFLALLANRFVSGRIPIFDHVPARRYPPLVEELELEFGVNSPVFMSVIFASLCRQLYDQSHLPRLNQIFREDLLRGPQVRTQVIELYRKIPMLSVPVGREQELPPPQHPTAAPMSQPHGVPHAGHSVPPSNAPLPSPNRTQPPTTSPIGSTHPSRPSQHPTHPLPTPVRRQSQVMNQTTRALQQYPHPQPGPISPHVVSSSPHHASTMLPRSPAGHVPYQYPSQQAPHVPARPIPGQLWQMNQQGQLVPFDAVHMLPVVPSHPWPAQPSYPTPTSAGPRGAVSQSLHAQRQQPSPRGEQPPPSQAPQAPQAPQVPQAQMQSMRLATQGQVPPHPAYAYSPPTPHRPPWPSVASQQARQAQAPQGSSHPGSSSIRSSRPSHTPREVPLESSSPHANSPSMAAPQLPWPSQVTQQNGSQQPQSPANLSSQRRVSLEARPQFSSSVRTNQAPNPQSGLPMPFLPNAGYRIPYTVQPNPIRLGLHQVDLRDPIKKLRYRNNSGESRETELFQYLHGFVLSPKFIDPNTFIYNWNFSLSEDDCARYPRTIVVRDDSPPIREYQSGCRIFRLRSIAMQGSEKRPVADLWPTLNTIWPTVFYVHVNDVELQVRRKAHNGKDLPLDLTDHLREGQNKISIHLLLDPKERKDFSYVFGIESIAIGSFEIVRSLVKSISAADVRTNIKKRLNSSTDDDDDLTVVTDSLTVSLIDPFMAQIFLEPARSIHCKHLECFDLVTFIKTRRSVSGPGPMNDNWRCPICNADARPQNLIVDQFLTDVRTELERRNQLDGAQAIEIRADGQWSLKIINDDVHPDTENQRPSSSTSGKRKADDALDSAPSGPRPKVERPASGTPAVSHDPIVVELD